MHKFIVGVFCKGQLVFQIGNAISCTHDQASFIVDLLSCAKVPLIPGHYLAYDYKGGF